MILVMKMMNKSLWKRNKVLNIKIAFKIKIINKIHYRIWKKNLFLLKMISQDNLILMIQIVSLSFYVKYLFFLDK